MSGFPVWKKTIGRHAAIVLVVLALGAGGCASGGRIKNLTDYHYAAKPKSYDMPAYIGEADSAHVTIALIDSRPREVADENTRLAMLDEVKAKARELGADAIQKLKFMTAKGNGFVGNPATPFPSIKQGLYQMTFLRAEAIKFPDGVSALPAATNPTSQPSK